MTEEQTEQEQQSEPSTQVLVRGENSGLTAIQTKAAAMLAEGMKQKEVAASLQIATETITKWKHDIPEFKSEIARRIDASADLFHELAAEGRLKLVGLTTQVATTLEEGLNATTPKGTPDWWARLRTAELLLKATGMFGRNGSLADKSDGQNTTNVAVLMVQPDQVRKAAETVQAIEAVVKDGASQFDDFEE